MPVDVLDRLAERVDDADRHLQPVVLGVPVHVAWPRRPAPSRPPLASRSSPTSSTPASLSLREQAGQQLRRDVLVHQQRLGRVADARPLHLRVVGDPLRHLQVGVLMHVDVAVARRRVHHRHLGDLLQRVLQPLAAARDDQVDQPLLAWPARRAARARRPRAARPTRPAARRRPAPRRSARPGTRSSSPRCSSRAAPPRCRSSGRARRHRSSRSAAPRRPPRPRRSAPASSRPRARSRASSPRPPRRPGRRGRRSRERPSPSRRSAPRSASAGRAAPRSGPPRGRRRRPRRLASSSPSTLASIRSARSRRQASFSSRLARASRCEASFASRQTSSTVFAAVATHIRVTTASHLGGWQGRARRQRAPPASGGTVEAGFEPLAEEFGRLMARGPRGGALVLRAGTACSPTCGSAGRTARTTRPWRPETQALGFSATKGSPRWCIHRLADRGLIDYDEPVATYWPEFAAAGKERITVRELLSHRAGLYDVQAVAQERRGPAGPHRDGTSGSPPRPPRDPPGRPAYHAITFGWLASGLARAVTGKGMRELVRTELAEPLGTVRPRDRHRRWADEPGRDGRALAPLLHRIRHRGDAAARLAAGHQGRLPRPARAGLRTALPGTRPGRLAHRDARRERRAQRRRSLPSVRPPGQRRSRPPTAGPSSQRRPSRASAGSRHAASTGSLASACAGASASTTPSPSASRAPRALGHYGFGGSGGWGDPDTGVSFGFVSSHIGNFTTAIGDLGILRLTAVARACAARAL